MKNKIDLHIHSIKSDGTFTPAQIAVLAKEKGLSAAALTDHDSMEGTEEFIAECARLGIEGIPGVEMGASYKGELHIVGLYVGGEEFRTILQELRNGRKDRNLKMIKKLQDGGYDIVLEDIIDEEAGITIESSGRLHIAKALVKKGYVKDVDEAFDTMLSKGKEFYVKRFALSPEECIKAIKNSGGVAVWAHPIYCAKTEEDITALALRLKEAGLDAMECLYSRYTDQETQLCRRVAEKTGLLMSGGSDFHGENKPDVELGVVNGGYVPYEFLEKIKECTAYAELR